MAQTTSAQQILARNNAASSSILSPELWDLVERYRADLVNQGYVILGSVEDAEDVAQETFCEAYRNPEMVKQAHSLGAWLRTINRGNALNRLRDRKADHRKIRRRQVDMPPRLATTGGINSMEIRDTVARAIEDLPAELREITVLHYWERLGSKEIAARLGVSPRTAWRRLREANLLLYEKLTAFLGHEASRGCEPECGKDVP